MLVASVPVWLQAWPSFTVTDIAPEPVADEAGDLVAVLRETMVAAFEHDETVGMPGVQERARHVEGMGWVHSPIGRPVEDEYRGVL